MPRNHQRPRGDGVVWRCCCILLIASTVTAAFRLCPPHQPSRSIVTFRASFEPEEEEIDPPPTAPSITSPVRSFYKAFDEKIANERIRPSNRVPIVQTTSDRDACMGVVTASELTSMVSLNENDNDKSLQEFARRVTLQGGWCLVEIDTLSQVATMDSMWDCLDHIFEADKEMARSESLYFRQQILSSSEQQLGGCDYYDVALVNDSLQHLAELVSEKDAMHVKTAFSFVASMAQAFTSVVSAVDCTNLDHLLHNKSTVAARFSGTSQRLAKYIADNRTVENLRSHCDWTLCTAVPVSSQVGLEIFTGDKWVRPEELAQKLFSSQPTAASDYRWNSRYLVLLSGKWLELLAFGGSIANLTATVHRVMGAQGRPSAPLFLRPQPAILDKAEYKIRCNVELQTMEECCAQVQKFLHEVTFFSS